jgi:hypothetical protein
MSSSLLSSDFSLRSDHLLLSWFWREYLYTVSADELLPLELRLLPEEGPLAVELVLAVIIPVHRER